MNNKYRHLKVRLYGSLDIFLSAVLLACAWGKIHWAWFWVILILELFTQSNKLDWGKEND